MKARTASTRESAPPKREAPKAEALQRKPVFEGYDPRKHGITQSLLASWLSCRERARLGVQRLSPIGQRGSTLAGSIFHDALETLYREAQSHYPEPWLPDDQWRHSLLNALEAKHRINGANSAEDEEGLEAFLGQVDALLPPYIKHWQEDFSGGKNWIGLESEFKVPAPGDSGAFLRGKMDGVFRIGEKLWLFETKTKAMIAQDAMDDFLPIDLQVQFYLYALRQKLGEVPCGVLYNVVRRPLLRQKKTESFREFQARIREDVAARPEHYFHRWEVPVTEREVRAFEAEFSDMIREFIAWSDGHLPTYKAPSACIGKWNCQYLPLCGSGNKAGYYTRDKLFPELE